MSEILAFVAAGIVAIWGVAHAIPTRKVVADFEPVTSTNRLVILQEWLAEAFAMWGLAGVTVAVTAAGGGTSAAHWVQLTVAAVLVALGALTWLTGARTPVIWFKICPVVLGTAAIMLVVAAVV
jgi:hypothetical protein